MGAFDFPLADPIQPQHGDDTNCDACRDAFVATLPPSGTPMRFSTYLGTDRSEEGFGIAVDAQRNRYLTGYTTSALFPTTPGGADTGYNGTISEGDVFAAKIGQPSRVITYTGDDNDSHEMQPFLMTTSVNINHPVRCLESPDCRNCLPENARSLAGAPWCTAVRPHP